MVQSGMNQHSMGGTSNFDGIYHRKRGGIFCGYIGLPEGKWIYHDLSQILHPPIQLGVKNGIYN